MRALHPPSSAGVRRRAVRGIGLIELVVVLALLGLLGGLAARGFGLLRDRWAVTGARNALTQLVREARGRAVARGGARLSVSTIRGDARRESGGVILRTLDLGHEFGVGIDLGGVAEAHLVFDPAGVGRMASRSIDLARGSSRDRIVVSTYGRVR
ncbi:MAG: hypothetical protein RLN75_09190 [Longimicrobiales bacterium]